MSDNMIITLFGFFAVVISLITPIIKLNTTITRLNVTIENLINSFNESKEMLKDHDDRIKNIEYGLIKLERRDICEKSFK